jgi:hypothetical protein
LLALPSRSIIVQNSLRSAWHWLFAVQFAPVNSRVLTQCRWPPPVTQMKMSDGELSNEQSSSDSQGIEHILKPAPVSSQFPKRQ